MQKKICLSIEQMQILKDLGIDTKDASMCWVRDPEGHYYLALHDDSCYEMSFMNPAPAFALQDMLEIMPIYIDNSPYSLELSFDKIAYDDTPVYTLQYIDVVRNITKYSIEKNNILDAAFAMLVWLAKEGYLRGGKL